MSQTRSAFCSSAGENLASVSCSHSLSETMFLFSLKLFGLICSEHSFNTPFTNREVWKIASNGDLFTVLKGIFPAMLYYTITCTAMSSTFFKTKIFLPYIIYILKSCWKFNFILKIQVFCGNIVCGIAFGIFQNFDRFSTSF